GFAENLLLDFFFQLESAKIIQILFDVGNAGAGPVRAEQGFVGDFLHAREIFQQVFWGDAADVEINIRVSAEQKESGVHPEWAAAVSEQNFEFWKIDGYIVNENGIAVAVAGAGKNRGAGVEHDGDSVGLGGAIDHFQFSYPIQIVVGKQKLVRRMKFDHTDVEPQNLLNIGQNVLAVAGVQAAAGDQTPGVFLDVIGDPLIDRSGKADDFGRDVVDEHAAINARGIHVFQERLRRAAKFDDLLEIRPLSPDQLQSLRTEHIHRRNVDVAVGDHVRRQLRSREFK